MTNAIFSVDLESWCDSESTRQMYPSVDVQKCTQRLYEPTLWLLDLLDSHNSKATFFVLGRIAKKMPGLIREIAYRGHEIASHGFSHTPLHKTNYNNTVNDLRESKHIIEDCIGKRIEGYRAPCFSITSATAWAYNAIAEAGFSYDSSVYPYGLHPHYGISNAPLTPYYPIEDILEFPMSCATIGGLRIPCSGGAYLRFTPWFIFEKLYRNVLNSNRPYIFYIHPWELDPHQPRVGSFSTSAIRQYSFLSQTRNMLEKLCTDIQFISFHQWMIENSLAVTEEYLENTLAVL